MKGIHSDNVFLYLCIFFKAALQGKQGYVDPLSMVLLSSIIAHSW